MARGAKRQNAGAAAGAPAKKAKTNPSFTGVQEGIELNAALSDSCRKMLISAIAPALGVPCEAREEIQIALVRMIGEVMEGARSTLRQSSEEEAAKVNELEGSKGALETKVAAAASVLTSASAETKDKTARLAEAAEAVKGAKADVSAKEEAQVQGDKAFDEAKTKLAVLEEAIASHYKPLTGEGSGSEHFTALLPVLKEVAVDESLMSALPSSCAKEAGQRSTFDSMAIEQLGRCLEEKAASFRETVESGAPAAEERARAVEAAKAAHEAASAAQTACAEDLAMSQQAEKDAAAALDSAKKAVESFEPELVLATKVRDEKAAALEQFNVFNMGCFELLRDAQAPKAPEPKVIEEAAAEPSEEVAMAAAEAGA